MRVVQCIGLLVDQKLHSSQVQSKMTINVVKQHGKINYIFFMNTEYRTYTKNQIFMHGLSFMLSLGRESCTSRLKMNPAS